MKKTLFFGFLLFGMIGVFFSCNKDALSSDEQLIEEIMNSTQKVLVDENTLPGEIASYVELNYAPILIEEAYHVNGKGYELWMENGINVYFGEKRHNCLGNHEHPRPRVRCLLGDEIDPATLPQLILDYVATNFPDETIEISVVKPLGVYAVALSNHAILIFDENGEFISPCGRWDRPGHPGRRCMLGMEVDLSELSAEITGYIALNYPDETIEKAVTKPSGVVAVRLSNNEVLLFDAEGAFIRECHG